MEYKKKESKKVIQQKQAAARRGLSILVGIAMIVIVMVLFTYILLSLSIISYAVNYEKGQTGDWDGLIILFYAMFSMGAAPLLGIIDIFAARKSQDVLLAEYPTKTLYRLTSLLFTNLIILLVPFIALFAGYENPTIMKIYAPVTILLCFVTFVMMVVSPREREIQPKTLKALSISLISLSVADFAYLILILSGGLA